MPRRKSEPLEDVVAKHGTKMIAVKIYFYTNDIGETGKIRKKHMWDEGVAYMDTNRSHGSERSKGQQFNGLHGVGPAVVSLLRANGVKVHRGKFPPYV